MTSTIPQVRWRTGTTLCRVLPTQKLQWKILCSICHREQSALQVSQLGRFKHQIIRRTESLSLDFAWILGAGGGAVRTPVQIALFGVLVCCCAYWALLMKSRMTTLSLVATDSNKSCKLRLYNSWQMKLSASTPKQVKKHSAPTTGPPLTVMDSCKAWLSLMPSRTRGRESWSESAEQGQQGAHLTSSNLLVWPGSLWGYSISCMIEFLSLNTIDPHILALWYKWRGEHDSTSRRNDEAKSVVNRQSHIKRLTLKGEIWIQTLVQVRREAAVTAFQHLSSDCEVWAFTCPVVLSQQARESKTKRRSARHI